jgi:hypothetical protein
MRVAYHPDFPKDIKRFEAQYLEVSERLGARFRAAVDDAIEQIKKSPSSAGPLRQHRIQDRERSAKAQSFCFPSVHLVWCLWGPVGVSVAHRQRLRPFDLAEAFPAGK